MAPLTLPGILPPNFRTAKTSWLEPSADCHAMFFLGGRGQWGSDNSFSFKCEGHGVLLYLSGL